MSAHESECRICDATAPRVLGEVEYYAGFAWEIYDCLACGCRFTKHDNSVYDKLHASGAISYYSDYRDLAAKCTSLFRQRDAAGLRSLLCRNAKYRFVIEEIERVPANARLLEIGCSRGYLTAYSILTGRRISGSDVSPEAVKSAKENFGDHFVAANSPEVRENAPYDVIYHVGMIGCVADPMGLTNDLLSMLRPGGKLLFNAPNVRSCYLQEQLWLDSAPPPDLVTLFPPGFWKRRFTQVAEVEENVEMRAADQSTEVGWRKLLRRRWTKPVPLPLTGASVAASQATRGARPLLDRAVLKAARLTHLSRLAPAQPSEFGLYVKMTKK